MADDRQSAPDIAVELCGVRLRNPTILASGVLGISLDMIARVAECGAGAAVIKSVTPEPREGHHNPTVIAYEAGMLNAVGYSNPGAEEAAREFEGVEELPIPVFASVVGRGAEEFTEAAAKLMTCGFAGLEVPLSCPHTPGYGTLAGHGTPEATERITRAVRQVTDRPLFVKLSPNVPGIGELALAALEGGADGISAVNTLGPGMIIDVEAARPVLDFKMGGVSGPALRPVAVRCVYDVATALRRAGREAPIIGIGGVASGRDVLQMVMAGASAVGVGTAVYARGIDVFGSIAEELRDLCSRLGLGSPADARGAALE
jgi:dihydroorotate dehydrogenase (NAD+) catalytic subunit